MNHKYYFLGKALTNVQRYGYAIHMFEVAIRLDPIPEYYINKGFILILISKYFKYYAQT